MCSTVSLHIMVVCYLPQALVRPLVFLFSLSNVSGKVALRCNFVPLDLLLKDEMRQTIEESVTVVLVVKSYI